MEHEGILTLQLVDFVVQNRPDLKGKERQVEKIIKDSLKYRTGDYGHDKEGMVYLMRFNVMPSGRVAHVLDLIIRHGYTDSYKLIKYIIARNWTRFPALEEILFERHVKYPMKKQARYKLIKFFNKERKNGRNKNSPVYAASGAHGGPERS